MSAQACVGAVLAGGASRRMGRSKAALMIGGEPLVRRVVARLRVALPEVVLVGPRELGWLVPGARVIADAVPGMGPLAGLISVLRAVATEQVFLAGCDMPFIIPALVREMLARAESAPDADAVVLRTSGGREQLHAIYRRSCLAPAEAQLEHGERALRALLDGVRVTDLQADIAARLDPAELSAFNANTPDEWRRALALAAAGA